MLIVKTVRSQSLYCDFIRSIIGNFVYELLVLNIETFNRTTGLTGPSCYGMKSIRF